MANDLDLTLIMQPDDNYVKQAKQAMTFKNKLRYTYLVHPPPPRHISLQYQVT
jgi:hypothetical protein